MIMVNPSGGSAILATVPYLQYKQQEAKSWPQQSHNASHLSELKACSHASVVFFLSKKIANPNVASNPDTTPPTENSVSHIHCSITQAFLSSAIDAKLGALFYNGKDAAMLQTTLEDMGHPQPATPIQTDNACDSSIANDGSIKQCSSKAIDIQFY
jgi:hypothetical protein